MRRLGLPAFLGILGAFALVAACGDNTTQPTETPTAQVDIVPSSTATATATVPTATATPRSVATASPTTTSDEIDVSELQDFVFEGAPLALIDDMDGLDVGAFDAETVFLTDLDAPTTVATPPTDFTLELP